jgi:hypothetical protein
MMPGGKAAHTPCGVEALVLAAGRRGARGFAPVESLDVPSSGRNLSHFPNRKLDRHRCVADDVFRDRRTITKCAAFPLDARLVTGTVNIHEQEEYPVFYPQKFAV